jgi:hypothetical protein
MIYVKHNVLLPIGAIRLRSRRRQQAGNSSRKATLRIAPPFSGGEKAKRYSWPEKLMRFEKTTGRVPIG